MFQRVTISLGRLPIPEWSSTVARCNSFPVSWHAPLGLQSHIVYSQYRESHNFNVLNRHEELGKMEKLNAVRMKIDPRIALQVSYGIMLCISFGMMVSVWYTVDHTPFSNPMNFFFVWFSLLQIAFLAYSGYMLVFPLKFDQYRMSQIHGANFVMVNVLIAQCGLFTPAEGFASTESWKSSFALNILAVFAHVAYGLVLYTFSVELVHRLPSFTHETIQKTALQKSSSTTGIVRYNRENLSNVGAQLYNSMPEGIVIHDDQDRKHVAERSAHDESAQPTQPSQMKSSEQTVSPKRHNPSIPAAPEVNSKPTEVAELANAESSGEHL